MSTFSNRFKKVLETVGESPAEVSRKLGVGLATVYRWLNGKSLPKVSDLQKLNKLYPSLNLNALITGNGKLFTSFPLPVYEERLVKVPVVGEVRAGEFEYRIYDEPSYESIPESLIPVPEKTIVLRVKGRSMHPKIPEGAVVVFVKGIEPQNGNVCLIVNREDGTATMKKIRFLPKNKLLLIPLNPEFEESIVDLSEVEIVGVLRGIYIKSKFF